MTGPCPSARFLIPRSLPAIVARHHAMIPLVNRHLQALSHAARPSHNLTMITVPVHVRRIRALAHQESGVSVTEGESPTSLSSPFSTSEQVPLLPHMLQYLHILHHDVCQLSGLCLSLVQCIPGVRDRAAQRAAQTIRMRPCIPLDNVGGADDAET
jgi:hypothetical protein